MMSAIEPGNNPTDSTAASTSVMTSRNVAIKRERSDADEAIEDRCKVIKTRSSSPYRREDSIATWFKEEEPRAGRLSRGRSPARSISPSAGFDLLDENLLDHAVRKIGEPVNELIIKVSANPVDMIARGCKTSLASAKHSAIEILSCEEEEEEGLFGYWRFKMRPASIEAQKAFLKRLDKLTYGESVDYEVGAPKTGLCRALLAEFPKLTPDKRKAIEALIRVNETGRSAQQPISTASAGDAV